MRRARLLLAAWAWAAAPLGATELHFDASRREFGKVGLQVHAEKVTHKSRPYLLVRLQPDDLRTVMLAGGQSDLEKLGDGRLAYLPLTVDCDGITLRSGERTLRAHSVSPCTGLMRFPSLRSMPAFVAFEWPAPGMATLTVQVTVARPDPPVQRSLFGGDPTPPPRVTESLLGAHVVSARLEVR